MGQMPVSNGSDARVKWVKCPSSDGSDARHPMVKCPSSDGSDARYQMGQMPVIKWVRCPLSNGSNARHRVGQMPVIEWVKCPSSSGSDARSQWVKCPFSMGQMPVINGSNARIPWVRCPYPMGQMPVSHGSDARLPWVKCPSSMGQMPVFHGSNAVILSFLTLFAILTLFDHFSPFCHFSAILMVVLARKRRQRRLWRLFHPNSLIYTLFASLATSRVIGPNNGTGTSRKVVKLPLFLTFSHILWAPQGSFGQKSVKIHQKVSKKVSEKWTTFLSRVFLLRFWTSKSGHFLDILAILFGRIGHF